MKTFREISAGDLESYPIKNEMSAHGYLLIRNLLPREDVAALLNRITQLVHAADWLLPGPDPRDRIANANAACGDADPSFKRIYQQIFNLESFHALAHHPALKQVMHMLVGPQLLVHPKPIGRLIFPNCERLVIHAHQDHQAIAGDTETFTAWMPLHDCPVESGPLQILEDSHHFGLQPSDVATGIISKEAMRGSDWAGGQINAGDVLIFHSLTIHAALPNISNRLRISMDCRFQNYERAVNPAELVFPGSSGNRSWESTYAGWQADQLKYFWKKIPLKLKPSKTELAELAQSADSPEMRSRYTRILSQIESQLPVYLA